MVDRESATELQPTAAGASHGKRRVCLPSPLLLPRWKSSPLGSFPRLSSPEPALAVPQIVPRFSDGGAHPIDVRSRVSSHLQSLLRRSPKMGNLRTPSRGDARSVFKLKHVTEVRSKMNAAAASMLGPCSHQCAAYFRRSLRLCPVPASPRILPQCRLEFINLSRGRSLSPRVDHPSRCAEIPDRRVPTYSASSLLVSAVQMCGVQPR